MLFFFTKFSSFNIVIKATIIFILFFTFSCSQPKGNSERFKQGVFVIPAGDNYSETIITRIDSLQIEEYTRSVSFSTDTTVAEQKVKRIDTLYIKWKNNFAYSLRMKTPKTKMDKDLIFVQINEVKDSSYSFTAKVGYSNFKQKGTLYILNKK